MLLKYHFKQQSKIMIGIFGAFIVLLLTLNLSKMFGELEWYDLSFIVVLMPLFFTSNIFSSEIEKRTDFLIFTSSTPKYKILMRKYISSWIISEAVIFIVYISALIMGFEKSLFAFFTIVIYSTVLSLVGLLVSNVSKNTLIGYGVALVIWALQMVLPASFHEKFSLMSLNINLINKSMQFWSNIFFMIVIIVLLVILNLFVISKGEHLRRKLIYRGMASIISLSLVFLFLYNTFFMKMEFWKDNKWKIVQGKNINVHYKNLDKNRAEELYGIYDLESKALKDMFGKNVCYNEVWMWRGEEKDLDENKTKVYTMPFKTLKGFNPVQYQGEYWEYRINGILMEPIFKNLEENRENEILKESWENYIYETYVSPKVYKKFKENKLIKVRASYDSKEEHYENLERELKEVKSEKEVIHALSTISGSLIYKLDRSNHEKTLKLLISIYNSKKTVSYDDIERFIKENFKDEEVYKILALYDEVRAYHIKYYGGRGIIRSE